ncbi:MAG: hypothetical protein LBB08_01555 [Rickettsiales bacterium]|jgi:hypothetical protein|nr:hypothetical protein [Rickettsiales bacterium]
MPAAADTPVIATKKYVDSGLATRVQNTIFDAFATRFDSFKTSAESFQNRTDGFATAAQGAKADTAVQPAALDEYVKKTATSSWWTDTSIVPVSGRLPADKWKPIGGMGLSSSWIVQDASRGYEFRGWSTCSSSDSDAGNFSNTFSENRYCWCKMSDPYAGSSWVFYLPLGSGSYCAYDCAGSCSFCLYNGTHHNCTRSALLNNET